MEESTEFHTISILFSRYSGFVSQLLYLVSGREFTHSSIALDTNDEYFYSFNTKGFRREHPIRHKNRHKRTLCLRIKIDNESYEKLHSMIEEFNKERESWSYNWVGIFACIVHIPVKRKRQYFCSQFIADLLQKAGTIKWRKNVSLYLPNALKEELIDRDMVVEMVEDII